MIIGIDMGASAVKLCGLQGDQIVFTHYESGTRKNVLPLLEQLGVAPAAADAIALTGLAARESGLEGLGLTLKYIREPDAIGAGAVWLSGRDDAVVSSIGTGSAFVLARGGKYKHLCGTGVGGGTLSGLALRTFGIRDMAEFDRLASAGNTAAVDLLIGDFVASYGDLDPSMTASNLAKCNLGATDADWAAGLANLVLQTLGTMSLLACRGQGASCVIVTGALAGSAASRANFEKFAGAYGTDFIIPPHSECATAIGAARLAAWC
jgi:type II pantothenate kinase